MNEEENRDNEGAVPEHPNSENPNMAALLETEGIEINFPNQGDIREGVIASIDSNQILVSIGVKSEGIISGREFEEIPEEELKELHVGDKIPVFVINPEDQNGNLVLSYNRAQEEASWEQAEKLIKEKGTFHGEINGYNKGGLIVLMGRLRGFVPASQVSLTRRVNLTGDTPEQRWGKMVGEEIDVSVIEVDRERRRLILSERAASGETRETLKDMVIDNLEIGDIRTGRVTSLADFGAFVNISGADGLVHLSEIAWERINSPADVLKVGQEVNVKIISIDKEKKRIGLSIRQLLEDPWASQVEKYQVGQLVEGTVTRLTKFGAFARLDEEFEGLIHISEISEKRIEHPKEFLHEGDVVTLRIIKIDPQNHRIGLSMRKVESMAYADMDWQTLLTESMEESTQEVTLTADEVSAEMGIEAEATAKPVKSKDEKKKAAKEEKLDVEGKVAAKAEAEVMETPEAIGAAEKETDKKAEGAEATAQPAKSTAKKSKATAEDKREVEPPAVKAETALAEKKTTKTRTRKPKAEEKAEATTEKDVGEVAASVEKPKTSKRTTSKEKAAIKEQASAELTEEVPPESEKKTKRGTSTTKSKKTTATKKKSEEPAAEKAKSTGASKKPKKSAEESEAASE